MLSIEFPDDHDPGNYSLLLVNLYLDEMDIQIISYQSREYFQAVRLRDQLLRAPLSLSITDEDIRKDQYDEHIGLFDDKNKVVGILLLTPVDQDTVKMRQLAVEPALHGQGLGKKLVNFAESFSVRKGYQRMMLHARKPVVPFYVKLGYTIEGDEFIEVTIPHYKMVKKLMPG